MQEYEIKQKYQHKSMNLINPHRGVQEPISVCTDFVLAYHFERIWNEPEILYLSHNDLMDILDSKYLMISEKEVLRTIKMWINVDWDERKQYFRSLLRCVRPDLTVSTLFH